jgi:hypothetical protein
MGIHLSSRQNYAVYSTNANKGKPLDIIIFIRIRYPCAETSKCLPMNAIS